MRRGLAGAAMAQVLAQVYSLCFLAAYVCLARVPHLLAWPDRTLLLVGGVCFRVSGFSSPGLTKTQDKTQNWPGRIDLEMLSPVETEAMLAWPDRTLGGVVGGRAVRRAVCRPVGW